MRLDDLNPQQRKAVELIGGPILIFAGAGSGKTRVLTHKIAYLVQEAGLPAENILAVTFTNKAADEMKQRVQQLLNMDVSTMSVGTFHSISARILRREIHLLGYSNDFVIYDQDDSRALVKRVIKDLMKPSRQRRVVNVYKIEKNAKDGETILVPGKVLSLGNISRKIDVAALTFSEEAERKIKEANGKVMTIKELLESNPEGKKVRILG